MTMEEREETIRDEPDDLVTRGRAAEEGDVAEPDAPTATEENEGMSTVLGAGPIVGVQGDASEE